jgi:hypothetical protein
LSLAERCFGLLIGRLQVFYLAGFVLGISLKLLNPLLKLFNLIKKRDYELESQLGTQSRLTFCNCSGCKDAFHSF